MLLDEEGALPLFVLAAKCRCTCQSDLRIRINNVRSTIMAMTEMRRLICPIWVSMIGYPEKYLARAQSVE